MCVNLPNCHSHLWFCSSRAPLPFPPVKELIDSKYFFCTSSVKFIPIAKACDGVKDCAGGEDETTCVSHVTVNTTFPGKANTGVLTALSLSSQRQSLKNDSSSLLQCVSRRISAYCRCTALTPAGGACVVTTGLISTRKQHVVCWDTHSECTDNGAVNSGSTAHSRL